MLGCQRTDPSSCPLTSHLGLIFTNISAISLYYHSVLEAAEYFGSNMPHAVNYSTH